MDDITIELLEDATDELREAGIGISELDLGAGILWAGDFGNSDQYAGVRVQISKDHYFVIVLEAILQAPRMEPEEAAELFFDAYQDIIQQGHDEVSLTFDEDNNIWFGELTRECTGRKDLVFRASTALKHPLRAIVE